MRAWLLFFLLCTACHKKEVEVEFDIRARSAKITENKIILKDYNPLVVVFVPGPELIKHVLPLKRVVQTWQIEFPQAAPKGVLASFTKDDRYEEWLFHIHGARLLPSGDLEFEIKGGPTKEVSLNDAVLFVRHPLCHASNEFKCPSTGWGTKDLPPAGHPKSGL